MCEIIAIKKSFLFVLIFWFLGLGICHSDENKTGCGMPFSFFLDNMREKAIKSGISSKTVSNVILNTKYLEEVIKLDINQIAFRSSFTDFSNRSVNEYRLLHGRKKVQKYESLFNEIWRNYGIPPEVIVSFWAMETDYGLVQGDFHTLSALATLANDCRRSELFQLQYLDAMQLVADKILDAEKSFGAWAGEVGQIQMLPSDIITFGVDGDGDGNDDKGYTQMAASSYLNSFFGSSNINSNPEVTLSAIPFSERDYGATIATINYSGNGNVTYSLASHTFFELVDSNKIKLKDDYYYDKSSGSVRDGSSAYPLVLQQNFSNALQISVKNADTAASLVTETIKISELHSGVFADSNVDGTALISLSPLNFYDKILGAKIATIGYSGQETAVFSVQNHPFLEVSGSNQLKLKDSHYYNENTKTIINKDFTEGYQLSKQGDTQVTILAEDTSTSKKLSTETFMFSEISKSIFADSNVLDKDESYTFVTDIKWVDNYVNYPKTGREEYQKNIGAYWLLKADEKISFSFLQPGASYFGTYNELDGIIIPEEAFKNAARSAFELISKYTSLQFEEVTEAGNLVGDFRIGIVDENHFGINLSYAAYSQGVSHSPTGGNIFFNGTTDKNKDGVSDYNEADKVGMNSWHFVTFLHEIMHSLGLKHPFQPFDSNDAVEGNANIMADQYDQYPYTLMSYTPLRNPNTFTTKYDGINVNSNVGGQYYPNTPMLMDIMALQEIYGAASVNSPGNNTYKFSPEKPPFEAIYDTGGTDTLDLSNLSGGSELNLLGNQLSIIGNNYLIPWKNEDIGTSYGNAQGSALSIISGTEMEKVLLPTDTNNVVTGAYSTYIVGQKNTVIKTTMNSNELGINASGNANDLLTLNQTTTKWESDHVARNVGNNGKGATQEELNMANYLKHDLSVHLNLGIDTINGTNGNDALFLQNFATTGNVLYNQDTGRNLSDDRIIGVEKINLLEGNNFLDLTSTLTSLSGTNLEITSGTGNDVLWLSDANETIDSGDGHDQITINGGTDSLSTGTGNDIVTISNYAGNLTITDFDTSKDRLIFKTSSDNVSSSSNNITAINDLGSYSITLNGYTDLSGLSSFSTYL